MISIILNTIGSILIIYSIYIIRKDLVNNKINNDNLNSIEERVKEYYNLTENMVEEFSEVIHSKLEIINTENVQSVERQLYNKEEDSLNNFNINPIHSKIIELEGIGLTKEEIARKLNKGIREIEIILKMYENKK
ncbi:hypothetical protein SAMN02745784_00356 [Tissierella praeacuta DSM 18095]|uniref:DUF2802 domain-containing protein n=1 Tax=Tissierella praeacuta DSM 18095 TaxID=1123404 RepID=A0A1M4SJG1_9FIRM|nr:hypothetical protein [Tissierella praeacuta]SHE32424.1 hypothetical protein SAMN02745784_00356 [Tissierella praeacuta DSM 18095]SUP01494.1 Uncharacterised protein [Tissierella praeacuta]